MVPTVDPLAPHGVVYRAVTGLLSTRFGRWLAMRFAARVDPTLMRLSGGRLSMGMALPSVNLTTTGARSGQRRTCTVLYFSDGDDVILVASNFGQDRHPAWYFNLVAHPQATLECRGGGGTYRAREVADDAERARLFGLADRVYAGYADYRIRAADRAIPIMRLTLATSA